LWIVGRPVASDLHVQDRVVKATGGALRPSVACYLPAAVLSHFPLHGSDILYCAEDKCILWGADEVKPVESRDWC